MAFTKLVAEKNDLLSALSLKDQHRLASQLKFVTLERGQVLYEIDQAIRFVYFPINSMAVVLKSIGGHLNLEVGSIGYDGMAGAMLALGQKSAASQVVVRGAGTALRMNSTDFLREFRLVGKFHDLVLLHICKGIAQLVETAACYRFHETTARLARWLLLKRDRTGRNDFKLTQDLLGHILGVRRVGVSLACSTLRQRGCIEYGRGKISITNGKSLERIACDCYRKVKHN